MHILISPAKTLDMDATIVVPKTTLSPFEKESETLIKELKKLKATEIQDRNSMLNVLITGNSPLILVMPKPLFMLLKVAFIRV